LNQIVTVPYFSTDIVISRPVAGGPVLTSASYTGAGIPAKVGGYDPLTIYTLSTPYYVGAPAEQFHFVYGTSTSVTSTLSEIARPPVGDVQAWFSSTQEATPTSPVADVESSLQRAKWEVLKLTSYLVPAKQTSIRRNFSRLVAAIMEDAESAVDINMDSVRVALGFLKQVRWTVQPQFSLTDDGNLYIHWYDGRDALVGVTFKPDGRAVWSASQTNKFGRMADAGERPADALIDLLPTVAPWAFGDATDDKIWRRAAG
jgi:hypothetical protein